MSQSFRKTVTLLINVKNPHTNTYAQKTHRLSPEQMIALQASLSACVIDSKVHETEKKAAHELLDLVS